MGTSGNNKFGAHLVSNFYVPLRLAHVLYILDMHGMFKRRQWIPVCIRQVEIYSAFSRSVITQPELLWRGFGQHHLSSVRRSRTRLSFDQMKETRCDMRGLYFRDSGRERCRFNRVRAARFFVYVYHSSSRSRHEILVGSLSTNSVSLLLSRPH